ncbi:rubrerythrin [Lentisphaerota bacterium WC36G]|nr:rubrerythrin family protein [Lentisphaerae bacterium WC36]
MSKTIENLMAAFAGESQARNKYTYWAAAARKEGFHYIADIFEETAMNEMQHAKDEFKLLGGIKSTLENLKTAAAGEQYETEDMYPTFAKEAEEEGEMDAARLFANIGKVEKHHEQRYEKLLALVESGGVFERPEPITWKCGKCGYVHVGTTPPQKCPTCHHPYNYYIPNDID